MTRATVTVFPDCAPVEVRVGDNLFQCLTALEHSVPTECGGQGICGKCRVQVLKGETEITDVERSWLTPDELEQGMRLACRQTVRGDMWVALPEGVEVDHSAKLRGFEDLTDFPADTGIEKRLVALPARPGEGVRSWAGLLPGEPASGPSVLRALARATATGARELTAVTRDGSVVALEEGDTRGIGAVLAVDIGTTTIAAYLVDPGGAGVVATAACANSQRRWGSDVLSRIALAAEDEDHLTQMQRSVRDDINQLILEVTKLAGVPRERIYRVTLVGNATMEHLFLGVDPRSLGMAPYSPVTSSLAEFPPSAVRLALPDSARAAFAPGVSGYVGADSVAGMLAADMDVRPELTLLIDVGTNGETMLGSSAGILCGSNAAGPAFEGARIGQGMRASKGAIERVSIDDDVRLGVIGNVPPRGICGSGLIDAVAAMLNAGVLEPTGRIADPGECPAPLRDRVLPGESGNSFVLATSDQAMAGHPVMLTQKDIREVQLAAGAIAAGRKSLCHSRGVHESDLERVMIAGAFGSYIDPGAAIRIGLLPNVPLERVHSVGNAAGYGACMMALSREAEERAARLAESAEYVEFGSDPRFQDLFVECMEFPT
jgi:uncharacterized 2Fe-2S/4Fe-4S cluster protein (DUF4445 family)